MFQYISCYSLSFTDVSYNTALTRFNTSHVTLYRIRLWAGSIRQFSFNTSHVTLYRISSLSSARTIFVSIHLMLLFIDIPSKLRDDLTGFNTSHVTLYHPCRSYYRSFSWVSIHLMLLFIR